MSGVAPPRATQRAVVLAGGGYVASSWEIGLLAGMADAGLDVRNADLFVGTSAGARVAIELASDRPLDEAFRQRAESAASPGSPAAPVDWARIRAGVEDAKQAGGTTAEVLRRYGALALAMAPATAPDRRKTIAAQLPLQAWPAQRVLITAVNAETGERRAFDRDDSIDLVDAIIATTASFGAAPPLIDGHHYIDGGYYSSDHADLATGYERVLILALRSPPSAMRLVSVETATEALRAAGSQVVVVHPDEETLAAMAATGGQMNPASGGPAAIAGRLQGQRTVTADLAAFWN